MKTKNIFIIVLFIASIFPLIDLLHPGLPITHDGKDHVARIANFYQNITEGNIIPRWAGNLNWGYGHPILMFLYPLPSYSVSIFHFFGFSLTDSLKIVFALAFIFSGFSMYIFVKELLNKESGFLSALMYMYAPYRFVDLHVRGAIGEHAAFIFPPLICYFLLKLSKKYSYLYILCGAFSISGLILAHNAITLMFLPIIFGFSIFLIWQSKNKLKLIKNYLLSVIYGFGLSSFFLIPAFFEGKYTLRDIVTNGEYAYRFVNMQDFLYGPWSYGGSGQFTVQIGIIQWLMVFLAIPIILILKKQKNKLWILSLFLFLSFFLSLFIMTSNSQFIWEKITTLQKFQFPWRFLSITVFITALFGGLFIYTLNKKNKIILTVIISFFLLFINKDLIHANGYEYENDKYYSGIYNGTTDTGESAPVWSVRFMERPPAKPVEIIEGDADIKIEKRTFTIHNYSILVNKKAKIRENTLYFPGWEVFVDGKSAQIEFQDQANRGLITFFVEEGKHAINIRFTETKLRIASDILSFLSLVIIVLYGILEKARIWQRFRLY